MYSFVPCDFELSAKQYVFWLRNETLLLKNERAVNLHQSIVEKYMRNADKLKQNFATQLRIFGTVLRIKIFCKLPSSKVSPGHHRHLGHCRLGTPYTRHRRHQMELQ